MRRSHLAAFAALFLIAPSANPAQAAVLGDCEPYVSVLNISEPWEDHSRSFANGAIRVFEVYMDPNMAAGAAIAILHPNGRIGPEADRSCTAIFAAEGPRFWAEAEIARAEATYDPARGLVVTVPVRLPDTQAVAPVTFIVNQATGAVTLP